MREESKEKHEQQNNIKLTLVMQNVKNHPSHENAQPNSNKYRVSIEFNDISFPWTIKKKSYLTDKIVKSKQMSKFTREQLQSYSCFNIVVPELLNYYFLFKKNGIFRLHCENVILKISLAQGRTRSDWKICEAFHSWS